MYIGSHVPSTNPDITFHYDQQSFLRKKNIKPDMEMIDTLGLLMNILAAKILLCYASDLQPAKHLVHLVLASDPWKSVKPDQAWISGGHDSKTFSYKMLFEGSLSTNRQWTPSPHPRVKMFHPRNRLLLKRCRLRQRTQAICCTWFIFLILSPELWNQMITKLSKVALYHPLSLSIAVYLFKISIN